MGLASALKDRGRIVRKEADAKRVEGRTRLIPVTGAQFKCRLFMEGGPETVSQQSGQATTQETPLVLTGVLDLERNRLVFQARDEIIIESRELGESRWEINGEPKPIRKKRRVIGWELAVARVSEAPFTRAG